MYATYESGAESKKMITFVLIGAENEEEEETWMEKVLLLLCRVVGSGREDTRTAFVQFTECILSPDDAYDAFGCVCL